MIRKFATPAAMSIVVALAACGSAKDANNGNFEKALNAHFARECIPVQPFVMAENNRQYPLVVALQPKPTIASLEVGVEQNNASATRPLDVLVHAGLLSVSDGTAKKRGWLGGEYTAPTKTYSLTDAGKKALVSPDELTMCAGHYKVDEVARFSEPSNALGHTISEVSFTFSPVDVPAWAKDDGVRKVYGLNARMADHAKGTRTLVLASDGWIDSADFSK
ncbi:hypothetical protein [Paraburkholderia sp. MM6662-R1]|uniref:hypothetical protein n=1 Tax=Paraburkholderia sp. MM6662-R1 TaxID=2991066 RepID=UPI003D1CBB77